MSNKGPGDLSTRKQTHMSVSLHGQTEFHFNNKDVSPKGIEPGKKYKVVFTALCTSKDDRDTRFRTTGLPKVGGTKIPVKDDGTNKHKTQIYKAAY